MSLGSLYAALERCERNKERTQVELKELEKELEICIEKKNQYVKQKDNFFNILEGEKAVLEQLYNLTSKNKISKRLHMVMNDKFYGRESSRTADSLDEIYRTINKIIADLKEKIQEKKRRIQELSSEISSIKAEIRREIERQRERHRKKHK